MHELVKTTTLQPLRYGIGTSVNWQSMGVVMGLAGACCSVSNGLIPLMGPKVSG